MPWSASDAQRHTKKARSHKQKRMWSHVADSMLARGASEGAAIRAANGVVKKRGQRKHGGSKRGGR
jgi:hypothetical protein